MPSKQVAFAAVAALCVMFVGVSAMQVPELMTQSQLKMIRVSKDSSSVSGISSGGCMATQLHVAYSSAIMGAGIVSGAPFWCAQSDVMVALSSCMKYPDLISVPTLLGAVSYAYTMNSIDNPVYLKNSNVFIFHGTLDNELVLGVAEKVIDFYTHYVPSANVRTNLTIPAAHSFVTKDFGNPCGYFGEPYMNNCNYDTAGEVLKWIYGPLKAPMKANMSNLVTIDQSTFVPFPWTTAEISMAKLGYAYIPNACHNSNTECKLHVALHGCLQNIDSIGFAFINYAGYNEWAEANNIIILYPQTIASPTFPYNPKACWDWWGYTGPEYATQLGPQLQVIRGMMRAFSVM
jgi:hypothetical protein